MSIGLDHTIIWSSDPAISARFLADLLGLEVRDDDEFFLQLHLGNGVTLDYGPASEAVTPQHYAFLVGDDEFDAAFGRLRRAGVAFWADPFHAEPGRINQLHGGLGVYFADPDGHNMELLTRSL
ncbi:VOC family protein [Actinomycetospora sp. C-140]